MAPQLSLEDRWKANWMLAEGASVAEVATQLGVHRTTIARWKRKAETELSLQRTEGSGRWRASTREQDNMLQEYVREHPFVSCNAARAQTGFPGSTNTACRRLREIGLKNCAAANKISISVRNQQRRVAFCNEHLNNLDMWNDVIFSDEKVFSSANDSRVRVYRRAGERYNPSHINPIDRSGRFSVAVWAWISREGPGVCWQIDGHLNSRQYVDILQNVMLPSVTTLRDDFVFQQVRMLFY